MSERYLKIIVKKDKTNVFVYDGVKRIFEKSYYVFSKDYIIMEYLRINYFEETKIEGLLEEQYNNINSILYYLEYFYDYFSLNNKKTSENFIPEQIADIIDKILFNIEKELDEILKAPNKNEEILNIIRNNKFVYFDLIQLGISLRDEFLYESIEIRLDEINYNYLIDYYNSQDIFIGQKIIDLNSLEISENFSFIIFNLKSDDFKKIFFEMEDYNEIRNFYNICRNFRVRVTDNKENRILIEKTYNKNINILNDKFYLEKDIGNSYKLTWTGESF